MFPRKKYMQKSRRKIAQLYLRSGGNIRINLMGIFGLFMVEFAELISEFPNNYWVFIWCGLSGWIWLSVRIEWVGLRLAGQSGGFWLSLTGLAGPQV